MALTVGLFLGILIGFLLKIYRKTSKAALLWSIGIPFILFLGLTILYFNFKKDPFDVWLGLDRYPTNWENRGIEAKAWGPTEADWGPEEEHWSTAIGLSFSRYFLGYLALGMAMYGVFLGNTGSSTKAQETLEKRNEYGTIIEKGNLKYGLKHGKWQFFDEDGQLIREEWWVEGELKERQKIA